MAKDKEIEELLSRGVTEVIEKNHLEKVLRSKNKIRVKYGIDPTGSRLHIGGAIAFWKLKTLQDMGHQIVFIIGDFTARIGDASDKTAERKILSIKEIEKNMSTYRKQLKSVFKKDIDKIDFKYNSKWFTGRDRNTDIDDLLMASMNFTVNQMIKRDNFWQRFKKDKPIGFHEFMYPLFQGIDSVKVEADLEVGGNDQLFNLLAGRTLQKKFGQKPQDIMTFELLEGTDGRKMSTSYNNCIYIEDSPKEMYGKIMSLKDDLIIKYFTLTTDVPMDEVKKYEEELQAGANPRDIKAKLAFEITKRYYGEKEAERAAREFEKIFKKKEKPTEMPRGKFKKGDKLVDVLAAEKIVSSKTDVRRIIQQNGVKDNDKVVSDIDYTLDSGKHIVQVGKRRFIELSEK